MTNLPLTTRVCDDTITKLEHQRDKALSDADFWSNAHDKLEAEVAEVERIRLQDQAKITELNLEVEKLKELNRNALADRDQVSKQLTKVREANRQLETGLSEAEKDLSIAQMANDIFNRDRKDMAEAIHYPDCWDTAAYPTLLDAIKEIGCNPDNCVEVAG